MDKYKERLTANASDFDSIVADMLEELQRLKAEVERYRKLYLDSCDARQALAKEIDDQRIKYDKA